MRENMIILASFKVKLASFRYARNVITCKRVLAQVQGFKIQHIHF